MPHIHVRQTRRHMATDFAFTVSVAEPRRAAALAVLGEAHAEVARLEKELSEFLVASPVHRFNEAPVGRSVLLTADGLTLWRRSLALSEATQGAFSALAKSVPPAAPSDVETDWQRGRLTKRRAGVRLGFGAIGKGFALDRVREILERAGHTDFCLTAGGSSQILAGFAAPGLPWSWGWSWKKDEAGEDLGLAITHRDGLPVALGVSGFHEKGRHILDAKTGRAVESPLKSALVAAPSAADADALSTALAARGWNAVSDENGKAIIDEKEVPRWNSKFAARFGAPVLAVALILATSARADDGLEMTEESVDLGEAAPAFNPYGFDRSSYWIFLPAVALALVILHLQQPSRRRKTLYPQPGETDDSASS